MKLSTRSRYACQALIGLAKSGGESRPIPIKQISADQGISQDYLVQLFSLLKSGGLVTSERGPGGGVMFAKPAKSITLADVIRLTEGSLAPVACVDKPQKCDRATRCIARGVWGELKGAMDEVLSSRTIAELAAEEKKLSQPTMYHI